MLYISQSHPRGTLSVSHDGSNLLTFSETRMGRKRLFSLNGRGTEAYILCHRGAILKTVAVESGLTLERVKELAEIATKCAVPWYRKMGLDANKLASIPENWYVNY